MITKLCPPAAPGADVGTVPAGAELAFDRSVPRTLVHKTAVSEVLMTDAVRTGQDRFAVAAQWPLHHVLFADGTSPAGTADPLILLETARQAGIYVSHVYYDVPLSHPFLLTSVDYEVEPPVPGSAAHSGPHCVLLDVQCIVDYPGTDRLGMSLEAQIMIDERPQGRVGLCWQAVTPERYKRIRSTESPVTTLPQDLGVTPTPLAAPVTAPHILGRQHHRDVMLAALPKDLEHAPGRNTWSLRLDTEHPFYFDHACDHIPGMALAESFAQASALTSARATGIPLDRLEWTLEDSALSFLSFGELDRPVTITADPAPEPGGHGRCAIRVSAEQEGRLLARGAVVGRISQVDGAIR
jgi:hypothetical protein